MQESAGVWLKRELDLDAEKDIESSTWPDVRQKIEDRLTLYR